MLGNLDVNAWVTIHGGCPLRCHVDDEDDITSFFCGESRPDFEFAMDAEALRAFVALAQQALATIDARAEPATPSDPVLEGSGQRAATRPPSQRSAVPVT